MIDAAADLADLIEMSKIELDEYALEELTMILVSNAQEVKKILKNLPYRWPCSTPWLHKQHNRRRNLWRDMKAIGLSV